MSEYDALDAMVERMAREEQEELDRAHGQQLLDIMADRRNAAAPLLEAINRAHQAEASEATDKQ